MPRKVLFRSPASHWQPFGSHPHEPETNDRGNQDASGTLSPVEEGTTSPPRPNESLTNSGGATPNTHSSPHARHHARRLRQFHRPDGRKVHICHTPEEHDAVRKRLEEQYPGH